MKTGEAAKLLDVTNNTVRSWTDHPALSHFFSEGARGEHGSAHRILTEADLLVLNTIRHLRNNSRIDDWDAIADHLETGKRVQEFPQNAISADPRVIPLPQAEQSARAAATLAERDAALARVNELETLLKQERVERKAELEKLTQQIIELNREVGVVESEHKRNDELHSQNAELQSRNDDLQKEIAQLNREIGSLEARLELSNKPDSS